MKISHGTITQATTPPPFDSGYWQKIITVMVADFGQSDPRAGCWQWIQEHHPDLWREHRTAMREIDQAYQQRDTGKIEKAVNKAKGTYNSMLKAWN